MPDNIEIKAKTSQAGLVRSMLMDQKASFMGTDLQTDTYFNVAHGRLKLREGTIEQNLIWYNRADEKGPKHSSFQLIDARNMPGIKELLTAALGIKVVVAKSREIFYIDNVKFHIDQVQGLGSFIEIEAGNLHDPSLSVVTLQEQCSRYMGLFGIQAEDLLDCSYSDLLLRLAENDRAHSF
jgi:predicted adenylyl cyclase CyaB